MLGYFVHVTSALFLKRGNETEEEEDMKCPPMFVAITTRPEGRPQRDHIREMWAHSGEGWGEVKSKFVLCSRPALDSAMYAEIAEFRDIDVLDCDEGYQSGLLTRKVSAAMERYLDDYVDYSLFMKVDDDTFISTRRICDLLLWREMSGKDNMKVYMGVFAEGEFEALEGHIPTRDPSSPWFESYENFPGERYPVSAKGGPGYILSRPLIWNIAYRGIAKANMLNNEDKAIAVWVDQVVRQEIMQVDFVNIPGTDGYDEHADSTVKNGTYGKYPHFLHHHLSGPVISCLSAVDRLRDPEATIDHCFH